MPDPKYITDANEAVADVAYRTNDICMIYPITPASGMSEKAENWNFEGRENIYGELTDIFEMQSEAGVAGAMHGALQTGALCTTFTASQGLLLMMPNMYKIAGELTPNVIHVATRSVASHALSVFCDHSDIMAVRQTGYAILGSSTVQEAADMALIAQAATLQTRIPFIHFFDGFRTSHETNAIERLDDFSLRAMINPNSVCAHKKRGLTPDKPVIRGTSQGPDAFFQSREAINSYYDACPQRVSSVMENFGKLTGRWYRAFEYSGHPSAEHVIVAMGSAVQTIAETVRHLNAQGEKVGLVHVRLYRPFSSAQLLKCLPESCRAIAVLDRCKEPGAPGEPLYMDVAEAVSGRAGRPILETRVIGGRYGLSSKEFTPAMVRAVFDNLRLSDPVHPFTVGIKDDLTGLSLPFNEMYSLPGKAFEVILHASSEGWLKKQLPPLLQSLNRNEGYQVQAFPNVCYDASRQDEEFHLRYGLETIRAPYLVTQADLTVVESVRYLNEGVVGRIRRGGKLLILCNSTAPPANRQIPSGIALQLLEKDIETWRLGTTAEDGSLERVMKLLPHMHVPGMPYEKGLERLLIPGVDKVAGKTVGAPASDSGIIDAIAELVNGRGDELPVSAFPADGTYPTGTSQYLPPVGSEWLPSWDQELCTQCGLCSLACPQGAIMPKALKDGQLSEAPGSLSVVHAQNGAVPDGYPYFSLAINPDQCTACNHCIQACEAGALKRNGSESHARELRKHWDFTKGLAQVKRSEIRMNHLPQQQLLEPLFVNPRVRKGCGQAPYLKMLSQLFGDRMVVANATGASSIFGGALPTTPWSVDGDGRGPAWSNSLFEDAAEFGLGMRLSLDLREKRARKTCHALGAAGDEKLLSRMLGGPKPTEAEREAQRRAISDFKRQYLRSAEPGQEARAQDLDYLVRKSVWIVGGDGWAYDIGYGGLDHVLASGADVNILVLDNEVYSNTGGQLSKATPMGARARFATGGNPRAKKDLGRLAMTYENVYVASVAIGAAPEQALTAMTEAEAHNGPSLILAYCHSPSHGIDDENPWRHHRMAVRSGQWLLYRRNPALRKMGFNPLQIDSDEPSVDIRAYLGTEKRYEHLQETGGDTPAVLDNLQAEVLKRFETYQKVASGEAGSFIYDLADVYQTR